MGQQDHPGGVFDSKPTIHVCSVTGCSGTNGTALTLRSEKVVLWTVVGNLATHSSSIGTVRRKGNRPMSPTGPRFAHRGQQRAGGGNWSRPERQ